jgi:hypothetical protein
MWFPHLLQQNVRLRCQRSLYFVKLLWLLTMKSNARFIIA